MSTTLILDKTGRVLLPAQVRKQMNLQPGTQLRLDVLGERLELTVQAAPEPALALAPSRRRVLPASGRALDAAAAVREERAAQSRPRQRGAR